MDKVKKEEGKVDKEEAETVKVQKEEEGEAAKED